MLVEGKVGPQNNSDGDDTEVRLAKDGTVIVGHGLGRYEEICRRGLLLVASTALAGFAMAASHASPLTAATGTPILGLFNPLGGDYDLVVMRAKVWTVSGVPGGPFAWNGILSPTGITGAVVPTQGRRTDNFTPDGPAVVVSNVALTGAQAGVMLRGIGGPAAVASGAGLYGVEEETAGEFVVTPGNMIAIAATAAGTTHVVGASISYALRKNKAA